MGTANSVRGLQVRRTVLIAALIISVLSLAFELTASARLWPEALVGTLVVSILAGYAAWELRHKLRTEFLAMFIVGAYGVLSILDSVLGTTISVLDPGTTLALMILIAVIYVATRDRQASEPVIAFAGFIAAYSVATVLVNDYPTTQTVAILMLGGPGQVVVIWLIHRLIETLANTSEVEARQARIQHALTSCSQALLSGRSKQPLTTALEALLDATDGECAYITVDRAGPDGQITWEIVAQAVGDGYPDKEDASMTGDYDQAGFLVERFRQGRDATLITSDLPMPIRASYEAEGIKAELIAPILMEGRWIGTLRYIDHVGEGTWSDVEAKGLMRAAEMVAAYWEREAAREGLIELALAKDRFIATVSHELRNPLAAVVGFAGELVQGIEDFSKEELSEIASLILAQGIEVTHLVDDLLTAERAASGNLTVHPSDISLLDECRNIVSSTIVGIEVEILGEEVTAKADGLRTRQILRNLLTNAARYGGNTVEIEVSVADGYARVIVRDNGPGVKGIDAESIFDPYVRSQDGQAQPDSVGLGLSVARQLARLMGGDLVYRRSRDWTLFELTLPLVPAQPPAPVNEGDLPPRPGRRMVSSL